MNSLTYRECQLAFRAGDQLVRLCDALDKPAPRKVLGEPRHAFLATHEGDESVFHLPFSIHFPFEEPQKR